MGGKIIFYLFYGLISGLAEFMPISASAQSYLLSELTALDTRSPLLLMMMHIACLIVVLIQCRHRIGHMRRELRLESQPAGRRKRQPDRNTVLDAKIVMVGLLPMAACMVLSNYVYVRWTNLVLLAVTLILHGIFVYVPQFQPGANRDARHMSGAEGAFLGLCAGLSAIPGFSRMGSFLAAGLLRGCDKRYILDIALLAAVPALVLMIVLDAVSLLAMGAAAIHTDMILFSMLAAVMSFGGAWFGIVVMRYICVISNYTTFAYYSWGLGLFCFIVYLMV